MVRRSGNAPDRSGRTPVLQTGSCLYRATAAKKLVDRRGYAPRSAGCKPADFLTNLAAHGGRDGIRTHEWRLMRPLPCRLATLRCKWHGVSVLPRVRSVLETELRELAPAV